MKDNVTEEMLKLRMRDTEIESNEINREKQLEAGHQAIKTNPWYSLYQRQKIYSKNSKSGGAE